MPVSLMLEISDADPLSGRVRRGDEPWQSFVGWTAFSLLLGAAVDPLLQRGDEITPAPDAAPPV